MRYLIRKTAFLVLLSIIFMMNVSCPQNGGVNMFIAVGRSVDDKAPEIWILSHKNAEYMPEKDLTISGHFKDNVGVTRVVAQMSMSGAADDTTLTTEYRCEEQAEGDWSVTFRLSDMQKLGVFSGESTQANFKITAYDAMSNLRDIALYLFVDTTLPTVEWQKPAASVRFSSTEKSMTPAAFDDAYSIDDPTMIGYFHNGSTTISGFVNDNFTVGYTYLRFYDKYDNLVAVTPVINQTVTQNMIDDIDNINRDELDNNGKPKGFGFAPEINEDRSNRDIEIGVPSLNATAMSWSFDIDTNDLTTDTGWFKVGIVTADAAGNYNTDKDDGFKNQFVSPEWLYVRQDADIPRNNFNFVKGASISYGGTASGVAFDDDGVIKVRIAAVPDGESVDLASDDWKGGSSETVVKGKTFVKTEVWASDTRNGAVILNWTCDVPEQGGNYDLYVLPFDKNGRYPENYRDEVSKYRTQFHVASEDDPKIVLDKRNITMLEDTCTVTGSFYDNQEVTSIKASLINFDGDVTNDNTIDVYPGTGEGTFTITGRDDNYMITTGQITTKYMFSWTFTPSLFKDKSGNARGMTFKKADIRFIAYDDENHSGDDVLSLQGDTENPQFLDTTPDNNVMINSDVTFSGHIYDNVDVSEIRIYCEGIDGFEPRVWKSDAVDNSLEVSDKEEYNIVSATGTVRKYYKRSFSTVITPSDIKYAAPTVVIEIKDRVGNENTRMINIKGDTTPPIVSFNGVASGSYMNNDGSITVLVNPAVQDRTNKLFRDISTITISKGSNNEDVLYNDGTTDEWSFDAENFVYSKTFALSPDWAAKLTNGDVNIKVRAKDVGGNTGEGSLYFIYDITPPYGMEITMPELKDSTSFAQIADDTSADITLAKINSGSYLNQSVLFKGIATDNNKVAKTVIKFFKVSDSSLVGSVTVDLSGDKSTDLGAAVSGISGVPSSYEFTLDTTNIDDGNYYVEITSFDAAGNSAADTSQKRYFKILQDADKPRVDFNTKQNATLFKRGAVSAMAYDDDGFSETNHFQYLVSQDTDDTMLAAFDNGTGLKDLTPDDGKTFSFTVNVGDNDGDWKVWVRPFDKNGQKGKIHKLNVKVSSNERPVIEGGLTFSAVDASYNNTAYAGRVTVSARAFAGKAENSIVQMWYRLSSTDCPAATGLDGSDVTSDNLADVVIGGAKQGGWYVVDIGSPAARVTDTLTFNTKQLCSSTNYRKLNVEVKAVNNLGDLSESVQDSIMVDNAKPVVTITSPAEDATIDGLVSFRGSMTDQGPELDSMYISYFDHNKDWSGLSSITAAAIKADKVTGTPVLNKWHQMDRLDASWSYTYDSSVIAGVSDGESVTVVVAAIDKLGNVGTFSRRLHLDQDNDRPIVKVNMNLSGKTTPSNYLLNKDGSLTGSVEDDDGVPRKIEYNYGTGWLIASENSQAFTFGVPDGKYAVNMRITDGMSGVFGSSTAAGQNAVKLRGSDGKLFGAKGSTGNNADTLIYVTIDTQDPEISDIKFGLTDNPTSSWADFQNTVLGGDNNKLYVKFTVTEKNNISSCKYTFDGGSPVDAVSVSHEGDVYTYTAEITIPADKTGTANLEFIVTDEASRQDTYRATLRVDNAGPTVRITAPEKNNKTIALSGSVYDNGESGMKGVYISYFVSAPSAAQKEVSYITNASNQGEAKNKWKYIGNGSSSSWETTFDTTVLTNDLPEQKIDNYPLTVAAIDNNNNISIQTLILNIDQNSDRPMIKFLSTKLGSDMRSDNRTWITTDSISGTVSDDDGVVKKIEVKVGDADWAPANTVLLSSGDNSFNYNKDKGLSDGDNNIYFRITDAEDGLFVSKAVFAYDSIIIEDASNPKVYYGKYADKADEVKKNTILYTTIDTTPPQINDEMFGDQDKNYTAISGLGVVTFGGTNKKRYLNIKFTAFDKNGIATNADTKPRVVLGNKTFLGTLLSSSAFGDVYEATIDLNGVESGNKTFYIRVKDVAAERAGTSWVEKQYTVKVDNDPPIVDFRSPNNAAIVYGSSAGNKIKGSLSDESGYSKIYVGYSKTNTEPANWTEVQTQLGSNVSSWTMNYNAASQVAADSGEYNWPVYKNIKDGVGAATGTALIEEIDEAQDLYVWMKATDSLGNSSEASSLNLKVLANADKPQITITYPSNESVVGGTIRITGTTQIEDSAVDSVWIQIDPDYGDTPFSDGDGWKTRLNALIDGKDVGYSVEDRTIDTGIVEGVRATGNVASWGLPINAMKEFNQDVGNRKVAIRAIAVEGKLGKNTTSDIITFEVDKNSPVFGDRETIVLKNGNKQKVYTDGIWIDDNNKKWNITGSIEDDTGIDKLIMTRTVNGVEQTPITLIENGSVKESPTNYSSWFTSIEEPQTGFCNWRMNIPVDRGSRKFGTVIYELEAFENSLDKKSSKAKYTINFDAQAPEFSLIGLTDNGNSITNRILNGDDMFYSMNGQMSEVGDSTANQSGFSRIAMFFTRTIGGRTYIIDPMLDKGSDGHANRIDVSTLSAGTKIHGLYCHTISGVSLSNNTMLTLPGGTTPRSKNIRPGGLCIVNDVVYRITNVSGQVVTVGSSLGSTASGLTVYFPVAQVIDNTSTEAGSMNDVFRYNDSGDPEGDSLVNRDYDQMLEGVDTSGATYTWTVTINSKNIYDGVVKVCFVAFDKAGNFTEKLVEATVKNNPPRLAGIVFGSDINGDEDVTTDETNTDFSGLYDVVGLHKASGVVMNGWYPNNGGLVDEIKVPATLDETLLTIKRKAFLRPEIVGGNGGLIWTIHVDGGNDVSGDFGVLGSYDNTVRKLNIPLEGETLDKMGIDTLDDAIVTLEITDKTEGGGTSAEYKIRANLILSDTEKPHIALKKFYWEDKSKSSVYTDADGNLLGHIELTDDLPDSLFKSSNKGVSGKEEYDLDTKVSGIIIFDGTADDNSVVQQIKVQIPKFKTVEVDRGSGDFALNHTAGDLSNDGWMFRVISDEFDKHTGANTVVWKFYWNTDKITNHADKDIELVFDAFDKGDLKSEKSAKCRVDVVPYITGVTTGLSALKSGNPSVYNRTALGHYPVADSEDKIKFEGFNLTGGTITFAGTSNNTVAYSAAGIAVPTGAKSGAAFITVNGMKSLNNDNKNDAKGSYSKTVNLISKPSGDATVYGNYYNRQPNGETNNLLVDDVIFDIWQFKDAGISQSSGYITEPIMKINPKNGILNFGFNSGPANYCMANGQSTSYTTWVGNFARFSTCGFTVDENGNTHGITVGLDTNPSSGSAGRMQYFTSKWGTSALNTNGNYEGKNSSRFENIGAPAGTYNGITFDSTVFIEDRFASPSLATVVHGTDTYVFLAYFDDLNGQIRFKWGNLSNAYYDTTPSNTAVTGKQAITFNQFMDYRKATGLANNNHAAFDSNKKPENFSTIAGTGFPTKAGTYVSIDVIKGAAAANDVIVATWYDSTESKWYYSYKVNPCNDNDMNASPSATPTSGNWRKPVELAANAGENCQIMVDAKGHIHIAAYDTVNADLKYAYLKSYNSNTFKVVTVDSYAFTGTNIRLDTAISADGNYIVPYIGYYMSSTQRPKIAYLDKVIPVATGEADIPSGTDTSELFIGKWECSIVPTPSRFADNYAYSYVNVGVWKDGDGKITTSKTGTESYDNQSGLDKSNKGYAYGNGTMNPIMGYATRVGTRGHLETAQMK